MSGGFLVPPPRFGRSSTPTAATVARTAAPPRWVRCSVDGWLHLLAAAQVAAADEGGTAFALCGRRILAHELTLCRGQRPGRTGLTRQAAGPGACAVCQAVPS